MDDKVANLRQARKAKARRDKDGTAAENRVRFGRTKAERKAAALTIERQQREHRGRVLDRGGAGENSGDEPGKD